MNNSYQIELENIVFRRATINDNLEQIANLIYDTNPYIYPYWFNNNREEAIIFLSQKIKEDNFFFNYNNIYIAIDTNTKNIIGIINALDKTINLDYNYLELEKINDRYKETLNNYIEPIIETVKNNNYMYISNVCILGDYRGKKVGTRLLGYFIEQMENNGYTEFVLECLIHNLRAKNLYHRLGFQEMGEKLGFGGSFSDVEVVFMKRKKGDYLPEEFQNFI